MMIKRIYETNGTHKGEFVFCPVNGWNCPYWGKGNICYRDDPMKNCLDFSYIFKSWEYWEQL